MPMASLKLQPGVDVVKSPLLNEAGIAESNLIRFAPTASQTALVQKMGGWTKFYANALASPIRALHAWASLNGDALLGVGTQDQLGVVDTGMLYDITPRTDTDDAVTVDFSTTSGLSDVTIVATGSNLSTADTVVIRTQVSVGGLILYGAYPISAIVGANSFKIIAATPATATVANGGAVPVFDTVIDTTAVTVTLADHLYTENDHVDFPVSTTVGGVTVFGEYQVIDVPSSSTFVISAAQTATSTATASMNGGDAAFTYYIGLGPPAPGTGYGVGGYGTGGYGTGTAGASVNTGAKITATDWKLDNFGENIIANPEDGPIYWWGQHSSTDNAAILPYAPLVNQGLFVAMPQRQIVAYGSTFNQTQDPLLVRWCDVENWDVWTGSAINQAGSYRLSSGSQIVGGMQVASQGLLWTDIGLWSMQYIGAPYVYSFKEIAKGCGLIAKKAAGTLTGGVYWMGTTQFFQLGANGAQPMSCPVWDFVFQNLNTAYVDNIRCAPNSQFNEIMWFFPSAASTSGENDAYVKFNILLGIWDYGYLGRSAWIDQSVVGTPVGAGTNGYIYQHEQGNDADDGPMNPSFLTGYFSVTEGQDKIFIDRIWPDFTYGDYSGAQTAQLQITFYCVDYPGQTPTTYGPYTMTQASTFISTRFRARLVAMKIQSSDVGSFWRMGLPRYRFQPAGRFR